MFATKLHKKIEETLFFTILFLALWHLAPLIGQMEHGVARYGVAPHLGTSLRVDGVGGVGELMQEVESLGFEDPFALAKGAGERGVPHQVVGVYGAFAVATTAVLAQVGGEGDRQRQATGERHALRKIVGVDGLKVVAVACAVAP